MIVLATERYTHVINVSALEGKFSVGKKSAAHPHTNMGKAALNMMTLTCARDFLKSKILVNAVDTGWVTDMAPLGQGAKAKTHATHVSLNTTAKCKNTIRVLFFIGKRHVYTIIYHRLKKYTHEHQVFSHGEVSPF